MNRSEFVKTLIIAPIAGFFGIKAVAKDEHSICYWHEKHLGKSEHIIIKNPSKGLTIQRPNSLHMSIHCSSGFDQKISVYEKGKLLHRQIGVNYVPSEFITKPNTQYDIRIGNKRNADYELIVDLYHMKYTMKSCLTS